MSGKKLYKSRDKKVSGVCGGVAEYFDIDPTIVRVVWGIAGLTTGFGLIAYIVAAVAMDDAPADDIVHDCEYQENTYTADDNDEIKGFKP